MCARSPGRSSLPLTRHHRRGPPQGEHNVDLKYRVAPQSLRWLYVGTDLNVTRSSFRDRNNTDTGLNLFGGYESLKGKVHPFVETRIIAGDGSRAQVAGGINFTL